MKWPKIGCDYYRNHFRNSAGEARSLPENEINMPLLRTLTKHRRTCKKCRAWTREEWKRAERRARR